MQLRKSNRSQAKIRIALQGASGSGKTYSSLLLAYGLCQDWNKIAVIDTENQSADLYSHLGHYNVLNLLPPFSPERYIEAIATCEASGMEVIIIDSLSHEWEGEGGILDIHGRMAGNSFTNWAKITPRHNALVQKILHSQAHVITTVRSKQDYVITEKNGKQVPEKVGLKAVQRDGLEYDFSIVFELDINHQAVCSKDRTQLFAQKIPFEISSLTGSQIRDWCEGGIPTHASPVDPIESKIKAINTIDELNRFYRETTDKNRYLEAFSRRAEEIRAIKPKLNSIPF
ncbi:MAG: AAA family ATPase [Algoriphagus sp.]|uniref:AAA family ATPase n=1 Tax=Algoriphagus sp. TaxID=1872435 RepID=UPI0018196D64|nr:AAA family ATPase [Algoriphagus sp.]NVJ85791.1 AAA family ATPase [Algoriphagus sp.]